MAKIAAQPTADWFGGWNSDIAASVRTRVDAAAAAGTQAQLVAYNIPGRDCGGFSSGGAISASAYKAWIRAFASGIGSQPAIVTRYGSPPEKPPSTCSRTPSRPSTPRTGPPHH